MAKANRKYKASVFSHLFGEPQKELELYNAFAQVHYKPDTLVTDRTLKDVLYMDRINDLSFSVGNKLVIFFEHQTSINENMALRYLLYCGRVYEQLIDIKALYAEKRTMIPTPEFYVLYNGPEPFAEKQEYRLSDSFILPPTGEPAIELVVTVYNINQGFNVNIVRRSENLRGYVFFISKVREYEQYGMKRAEAIKKAIKDCIDQGILADYLKKYGSEVSNMLLGEWDWKVAKEVWQQEAKEESDSAWQSVVAVQEKTIAVQDKALADKDKTIAVQDKALADKDKTIAVQDKALADKDKMILDISVELATLKASPDDKSKTPRKRRTGKYQIRRSL